MKPKAKAIAIHAHDPLAFKRQACTFLLTLAVYLALCSIAFAACNFANNTSPMGEVLCEVVDFIYGNLGRGLATLAIIMLGVGALLGKTSWGMAITVAVGISVIFNAETIASLLLCGNSSTQMC